MTTPSFESYNVTLTNLGQLIHEIFPKVDMKHNVLNTTPVLSVVCVMRLFVTSLCIVQSCANFDWMYGHGYRDVFIELNPVILTFSYNLQTRCS